MNKAEATPGSAGGGHPLRAYSRVEAYLPLTVQRVPVSERKYVKSRRCEELLLVDFGWMPDLETAPQLAYLDGLNQKVDSVIEMLTLQCGGFHALPFKYVSLSGGGVKFSHPRAFALGDILEFKMILSIAQPVALFVYGEVIQVENQTDGHYITAHFIQTDDQIRDLLVRFVFETEREALRERNR
jgi:hypothetical protein